MGDAAAVQSKRTPEPGAESIMGQKKKKGRHERRSAARRPREAAGESTDWTGRVRSRPIGQFHEWGRIGIDRAIDSGPRFAAYLPIALASARSTEMGVRVNRPYHSRNLSPDH